MSDASIYDLSARAITGEPVPLEIFRGKVLLMVNVASQCGFTPQYAGLEALYRKHREAGLEVLGFPCNQFGAQEPGGDPDIAQFCETRFGVSFPMFAKIEVNGANTHPLYAWLKSAQPGLLGTEAIKWNFTKFLVGRDGKVIGRYASTTTPEAMEADIVAALAR
ncbi:MAG: glutathione peroxidase [Burkholderiales bacterium]|nr:glutathione peroxidase [Burkholderiales bacterium]